MSHAAEPSEDAAFPGLAAITSSPRDLFSDTLSVECALTIAFDLPPPGFFTSVRPTFSTQHNGDGTDSRSGSSNRSSPVKR